MTLMRIRHGSRAKSWRRRFQAVVFGALLSGTPAFGDYVRGQPFDVVQPDGTCLRLLVTGDEHYRWVHDEKGRVILRDEQTGLATYAIKVDGNVVPGSALVGVDDPDALGIELHLMPDPGHFPVSPYAEQRSPSKGRSIQAVGKPDFTRINNLVIFVRFADEKEFPASRPISLYDESFFNGASSTPTLKSYFLEASYKKTTIESTFYPTPKDGLVVSYQDSRRRSYYQEFGNTNPDGYRTGDERKAREWNLVASAASSIASQVPADLDIDTNGDGKVDGVVFVVNGSSDVWNSLLWPHKWQLGEPYANTRIKGKLVYTYNFEPDVDPVGLSVGTLSHEFFHTLGAPDLYHYDSCRVAPPNIDPVSTWDLMNTHERIPTHMGAHMKWKYGGFVEAIPLITASGVYTLSPLTSPSEMAYRIASPYSEDEYYVVEYRKKAGMFELGVPSEGLLVTRINRREEGNDCGSPDEVYVFRPGGSPTLAGTIADAPLSSGSGRTAMGETTDPVPFLRDGSSGGLAISSVGPVGDKISFRVDIPAGACLGSINLTAPADGGVVTGATADLSWAPAAGTTSYDVYLGTSTSAMEPRNLTTTSTSRPVEPDKDYYWKVAARGTGGCSRSSAVQTFRTRTNTVTKLTNGVPVSVASGDKDSWQFFSIDVPPGARTLTIEASGGQGAVDLYARYGQIPIDPPYDCSPAKPGSNEKCLLSSPWVGTYYVLVNGYTAHSRVSLVATWSGDAVTTTPLAKNVPVPISDSVRGNVRVFTVAVPLGASNLTFKASGGTGNADMSSRYLAVPIPDLGRLDACSSATPSTTETCRIPRPSRGTYYLAVTATTAYENIVLVADWVNAADPFTCTPDATTMCLGPGGRFKVQADYKDHRGDVGQGKVGKLTDLSGYLYFWDPSNVELVAKFVSFCDGTSGNWSIYVSGLTDVEVTFKVTDTKTGFTKEYKNPLGNLFCTIGDGPFSCPAGVVTSAGDEDLARERANLQAAALLAELGDGPAPERWIGTSSARAGAWNAIVPARRLPGESAVDLPFEVAGGPSLCTPDATTMCLGTGGRFRVQADYRDYAGKAGQGKVAKLTDLSGYLYFSDPSSVELVAKFVSSCDGHAGNWGIYLSGLTDVEVTFKVTDTKTGLYKEYGNSLGNRFCTVRDGPFTCP